jgi:hypothetical protein
MIDTEMRKSITEKIQNENITAPTEKLMVKKIHHQFSEGIMARVFLTKLATWVITAILCTTGSHWAVAQNTPRVPDADNSKVNQRYDGKVELTADQ